MLELKGYCTLKSTRHVVIGLDPDLNPTEYNKLKDELDHGCLLTIVDIAVNNTGFLCFASDPGCVVDVQSMDDVYKYFYCDKFNDVLLPPGLDDTQKLIQSIKRVTRDGGYNHIIRKMVIGASLIKGEFTDDFLFTKRSNKN